MGQTPPERFPCGKRTRIPARTNQSANESSAWLARNTPPGSIISIRNQSKTGRTSKAPGSFVCIWPSEAAKNGTGCRRQWVLKKAAGVRTFLLPRLFKVFVKNIERQTSAEKTREKTAGGSPNKLDNPRSQSMAASPDFCGEIRPFSSALTLFRHDSPNQPVRRASSSISLLPALLGARLHK